MDTKSLRKRLGMTQQEFAVALGCAVATVSRWETGINEPSGCALKMMEMMEREKPAGKRGAK
jgi:putative transcriptional regulator